MNQSNSKIKILIFLLCLIFLQTLSYSIYSLEIRDNQHYSNFYNNINVLDNGLISSYIQYQSSLGASEPVFFILNSIFNALSFDYSLFILSLNVILSLVIAIYGVKYSYRTTVFLLFSYYIATDYYIFVLFSEAQRLKVAIIFVLIYLISKKKSALIISLLSHTQIIFLILSKFKLAVLKKPIIVFSLMFFLGVLISSPAVVGKVMYYLNQSLNINNMINNILSSTILVFAFLLIYVVCDVKIDGQYLFFIFMMLMASFVFGKARINIFIFEVSMFYLFYLINKNYSNFRLLALMLFVVLVSVFNIYKISSQYHYLMAS
ncbi:TPA: hypothetical protein ACPVXI_003291 [Vibrio parahaemolyticus]|nr:hypothetical protein [Vibrio parahaemolyticus]EJG1663000.1 hypothetical protein [Vibrio parahaemolyticus]EJG1680394.1 hypothetical protein [Vibrio parahaemolyticus]EJG1795021.1 hypothetical protein [Vibrio parahaemolyticus]MDF4291526.1 hypothetical protein [Vibrio parahaemolyticus]